MRSVLQTQGDSRARGTRRAMETILTVVAVLGKPLYVHTPFISNPLAPARHLMGRRDAQVAGTTRVNEQNFDEALVTTPGLVMVDFWAEWCGPCRAIAPVLEVIADASDGRVTLMKVNVDENPGLAARYGIQSIPTILFVKEGVVVDRVVGAAPKAIRDIVNARAS